MPIRSEHRFFHQLDQRELLMTMTGTEARRWGDERGRWVRRKIGSLDVLRLMRTTRMFPAAAHSTHDTIENAASILAAFCQGCHLNPDRLKHRQRRWMTLFRRKASGELFSGTYA